MAKCCRKNVADVTTQDAALTVEKGKKRTVSVGFATYLRAALAVASFVLPFLLMVSNSAMSGHPDAIGQEQTYAARYQGGFVQSMQEAPAPSGKSVALPPMLAAAELSGARTGVRAGMQTGAQTQAQTRVRNGGQTAAQPDGLPLESPEGPPSGQSAVPDTAPPTQDNAGQPTRSSAKPSSGSGGAAAGAGSGGATEAMPDVPPETLRGPNAGDASGEPSAEPVDSAGDPDAAAGTQHDATETGQPGAQAEKPPGEASAQREYPTPNKVAYITIDDGPSRAITPGILNILRDEGIKATFFILPHDGVSDIYQRIIDEGHEIGNHSASHVYSKLYSSGNIEAFKEDVLLAQSFMLDNFGYLTTTFRFPGGAMGRKSSIIEPRREFLKEIGYRDFDWHVDTGDANSNQKDKSAAALTARVLNNTRDRERLIVLMHDTSSKSTTLEALPGIIAGLREQGYSFDILRNY